MDKLTRRDFLRKAGLAGAFTTGLAIAGDDFLEMMEQAHAAPAPTLSVASKGDIEALVKKAIDGLGGIGKFVKKGNSVVIKPNLAWARAPEVAANTNPKVITGLVKLCKQAGAGRITIMDHTCDNATSAFNLNGGKKAAESVGVRLVSADKQYMYQAVKIPKGKVLKSDMCIKEIIDADVFISVPIAKVHGGANITASMKNLMGTNWDRQRWHKSNLEQCIADYSTAVKADLIVLDAIRILLTRGPKGPGETKDVGQIIAGTDPVAMDAYAATLLGKNPAQVKHIAHAAALGVGVADLKKVTVKRV